MQAPQNNQKPREKRRANQHAREKMKVKRDLGARTTTPKQSQQPRNARPERRPQTGNRQPQKTVEKAKTLIHPRLKTEWGKSPCPTTHSCRQNTGERPSQQKRHRRNPQHEKTNSDAAEQAKPKRCKTGRAQTPQQLCIENPKEPTGSRTGRQEPRGQLEPRGKQGLPKGMWLAPRT